MPIRPPDDPVVREHFGETDYKQGTFGRRLRELIEGHDVPLQHQVDGLIRFSANILAHHAVSGTVTLPSHRNVEILHPLVKSEGVNNPDILLVGAAAMRLGDITKPAIGFDHHTVNLDAEPSVVMDYGPGLQGRHHIDRQLEDLRSGQRPYAYFAIGKGPFANEFLQQYWSARLGDNPAHLRRIIGSLYIGREDGIAAATTEFSEVQKQHTGSSEIADIVVVSAVQTAGHDELDTGIANAHKLLKPGGILLMRAPKAVNSRPDSVPAESMVEMALQAGFDRNQAQFFDVVTGSQAERQEVQTLSAVFRK